MCCIFSMFLLMHHTDSRPEEMLELMEKGTATRATASTRMNADSSRSYQALLTTSAINMTNTKYTPGLTQCSW